MDDIEVKVFSKEELRDQFIDYMWVMIKYWANVQKTDPNRTTEDVLSGLVHSIFCYIDGCAGASPCPFSLVTEALNPDDIQFWIENNEPIVFNGMAINDDVMLHELLYLKTEGKI